MRTMPRRGAHAHDAHPAGWQVVVLTASSFGKFIRKNELVRISTRILVNPTRDAARDKES